MKARFICYLGPNMEQRDHSEYITYNINKGDMRTYTEMWKACRLSDRFVVFAQEPAVVVATLWDPVHGIGSSGATVSPRRFWTYATEDQAIGVTLSKWDILTKGT